MKFLLLGYTIPTNRVKPVAVTIDFSQLEKRKCKQAYYNTKFLHLVITFGYFNLI